MTAGLAPDDTVVVAGNGPSLVDISTGRVLASDLMFRTNNFFFETAYHLGPRVDLAMIAGDPRTAPFVAATLASAGYDLRRWSATNPKVRQQIAPLLSAPFEPHRFADPDVTAEVHQAQAKYQARPTSGVSTLLLAHAMGARHILLAGIDLYAGATRYPFQPGPRMSALMGGDIGTRGWDRRLHDPDLDRHLICWLADRPGISLYRTSDALSDLLDLAPERSGDLPDAPPKPPCTDWVPRAGALHWRRLLWLRRLRRIRDHITGKPARRPAI